MPHFVEALQQEAAEAIARMQEAALRARHAHARAELMRHMLTTARKVKEKPKAEAVETVAADQIVEQQVPRADAGLRGLGLDSGAAGLGQAKQLGDLVERLARSMDMRMTLSNHSDGGAMVVLSWGAA